MFERSQQIAFPDGFPHAQDATRMVLCAGAKSSASTWLFNVVAEIMRGHEAAAHLSYMRNDYDAWRGCKTVRQFYADSPDVFPRFDPSSEALVVQSQRPSALLCALAVEAAAPVVMTIREPRDAVASLMKRFGYSFAGAFRAVSGGATRMLELFRGSAPLVMRFEDRFYDRAATISSVAEFLQIDLPVTFIRHIHDSLTPDQVRRKIEMLETRGAFGSAARAVAYDPETRWRPGHIGDTAIGQHAEILSREEQLLVLRATADYCRTFGYPAECEED
jgi:hypothetical protein